MARRESRLALLLWGVAATWLYRIANCRSLDAYLVRKTLLEAGLGCPSVNVLEAAHADCQRLYDTIIVRHKAEIKRPTPPMPRGWPGPKCVASTTPSKQRRSIPNG